MKRTTAFTLIELLVVILIIGILAAVALPQYRKAVEKSKTTEARTILATINQAVDIYYLSNGDYPTKFEELDIEVPGNYTGNYNWYPMGTITETKSTEDWSITIEGDNPYYYSIMIARISGIYQGTGFGIWKKANNDIPLNQITCFEFPTTFSGEEGDFCTKVMQGTLNGHGTITTFSLP